MGCDHTFGEKRHSLEMQIVHKPVNEKGEAINKADNNQFIGAVVSVVFSEDADVMKKTSAWLVDLIDEMFDSFEWSNMKDHEVEKALLGEFLEIADYNNRHVYIG